MNKIKRSMLLNLTVLFSVIFLFTIIPIFTNTVAGKDMPTEERTIESRVVADIDLSTMGKIVIRPKQNTITNFTLDGMTVKSITIISVDEVAGNVTLTIESKYIILNVNESKEVDVDSDGTNDLNMTLNKIIDGMADITIKKTVAVPIEKPKEITPTEKGESLGQYFVMIGIILALIISFTVGYWRGQIKEKEKTERIREHYKQMIEEVKREIKQSNFKTKELKENKNSDWETIEEYREKIRILEKKNEDLEEKNKGALKNKKEIQEEINKDWERTIEIMKNDNKKEILKYFMNALDSTQRTYENYKNKNKKEAEDIETIYKTMSNALEHLGIEIIPSKGKDKLSGYKINGKVVRDPKND